jgi:hypothetical protein
MGKLDENLTENACNWNLQGQLQLLGASGGQGLDWVTGCLPECSSATAAVPQIAANLLHRQSRQPRANSGLKPIQASGVSFPTALGVPIRLVLIALPQRGVRHD